MIRHIQTGPWCVEKVTRAKLYIAQGIQIAMFRNGHLRIHGGRRFVVHFGGQINNIHRNPSYSLPAKLDASPRPSLPIARYPPDALTSAPVMKEASSL